MKINNSIHDNDTNKPRSNGVYLILDNIRSILNVGAIFRTADAAGVKKVYLCGLTAYPSAREINNPAYIAPIVDGDNFEILYIPTKDCIKKSLETKIAKTALKALGEVDFEYKKTTTEAINEIKKLNIPIVALEQNKNSIDYRKFNYPDNVAIIVGNEIKGVEKNILELCDSILEIPLHGHVASLNVATATGIILFKAIE